MTVSKDESMKKEPAHKITPEEILADHTPEVRALVERLREIVRATVPSAVEAAYPGWHAIGYRHPGVGYFCGIFPERERVRIAFEFGILLPDPQGALGGTGTQVRYLDIPFGGKIPVEAFQQLLLAAIQLPEEREVRLSMVRNAARLVD
jgi:hypothetical protein